MSLDNLTDAELASRYLELCEQLGADYQPKQAETIETYWQLIERYGQ